MITFDFFVQYQRINTQMAADGLLILLLFVIGVCDNII